MQAEAFLREIESALELPAGSLTGNEQLADIPEWDSLAVISFIALVDEKLGLAVDGEALANAGTVGDLLALVHEKLAA
ncbi:MAG: acyl carrier protein [Aliidongia sp.]